MDGLSGSVVFMGVFGSKNTLAMFMSFLAIFAATVLADRLQPRALRLLAVAAFVLSIPLLIRAHSAGAAVTTILSFIVMGLVVLFARMQPRERMLTLTCATIVGIPLALVCIMAALNGTLAIGFDDFISGVLGKDPTLTGRTVLWHIALTQIHLRPLLGVGYSAFWIQGHLLPEGIWRAFQIDNRMGFHFHDTYLEVAVETGWTGVAALVVTFALALINAMRLALAQQSWVAACFVTIMFCLLVRSVGEVDVPYPFAIGTYLLFVIAAYGADFARGPETP
jgi:exopolysaccharide production protein ExoQ